MLRGGSFRECGAHFQFAGTTNAPASLTDYIKYLDLRIDLILECTGYSPLAFEAMSVLGANGVLALLGISAGSRKLEIAADALNLNLVLDNTGQSKVLRKITHLAKV